MASRPLGSQIDVHEAHDYPVLLGESLKDISQARSKYLQLRYNWQPSSGFRKCRGSLKKSKDGVRLSYYEDKPNAPLSTYSGSYAGQNDNAEKETSELVLVFDETKTAFVLESIVASADMNIVSSTELSEDEIGKLRQLQRFRSVENLDSTELARIEGEDEADPSNPFDYRHFMTEARETMEKAASQSGSRTPLAGNTPPIGRIASPSLPSGRFTNTTSFIPSATSSQTTKRMAPGQSTTKAKTVRKSQVKRKEQTSSKAPQPLSKERISDSDEEVSDAIPVEPTQIRGQPRDDPPARNTARGLNMISSDGGLEIIGGSPPPGARPSYRIDVEAFRSQTHTPKMETNRNRRSPPRSYDNDVTMRDVDQSDSSDEDGDVEPIELDDGSHNAKANRNQPQHSDTPPAPVENDDDDDDALAAELLEALEKEETAEGSAGVNGYGHVVDDESEISEEE